MTAELQALTEPTRPDIPNCARCGDDAGAHTVTPSGNCLDGHFVAGGLPCGCPGYVWPDGTEAIQAACKLFEDDYRAWNHERNMRWAVDQFREIVDVECDEVKLRRFIELVRA